MRKNALLAILIMLGMTLSGSGASANFSISPGVENRTMRFQIQSGARQTGYAYIRNTSEEPTQVHIYANDGAKTNDGHFAVKLPTEEQTGLGLWTTFDESVYTLEGKESMNVPFHIAIPAGIPPGVYSGGLALEEFDEAAAESGGGTSVQIKTRVVVPFFVEVPGEKVSDLAFNRFAQQHTGNNKVFFTMQFTNNGNTALVLKPKINISSFGGLFSETITDEDIQLYMGESTEFRVNWNNKPFFGFFNAEASVAYYENDIINNVETLVGEKTATISVNIIPWTTLLIILILIVLIAALVIYHQGRIKKLRKNSTTYVVQQGETLNEIAKKSGVDWKLVAKLNKMKPPYELTPNQKILIPPKK